MYTKVVISRAITGVSFCFSPTLSRHVLMKSKHHMDKEIQVSIRITKETSPVADIYMVTLMVAPQQTII
jgi:hypothetical protein